jgi:wyosine [tRNA(Phe)-imidazoG37] synthetase (radical SAM superfamily)
MATFLFDKIIFGPVISRRLGISLGVNVLPLGCKFCNFDCVYCECGLSFFEGAKPNALPTREEISQALKIKLISMQENNDMLDVITFAGNGEPTLHPEFSEIVEDTIFLRNTYFPSALVSVLSNSTMLSNPAVIESLKKVDRNILKLDSGLVSTIEAMNQPEGKIDLPKLVSYLKQFDGKLIIQTMFTKGTIKGKWIDNTTQDDLQAWEAIIGQVRPQMVMIYTIDRDTPYEGLQKIPLTELNEIALSLENKGIEVQVSG